MERDRQIHQKCKLSIQQFKVNALEYMGDIDTVERLQPGKKEFEVIMNMPALTDVTSMQQCFGMTRQASEYIPNESAILHRYELS